MLEIDRLICKCKKCGADVIVAAPYLDSPVLEPEEKWFYQLNPDGEEGVAAIMGHEKHICPNDGITMKEQ